MSKRQSSIDKALAIRLGRLPGRNQRSRLGKVYGGNPFSHQSRDRYPSLILSSRLDHDRA